MDLRFWIWIAAPIRGGRIGLLFCAANDTALICGTPKLVNLMLVEMYLRRFDNCQFHTISVNEPNNFGMIEDAFNKRLWDAEEI